jgi:hypothetical protein
MDSTEPGTLGFASRQVLDAIDDPPRKIPDLISMVVSLNGGWTALT